MISNSHQVYGTLNARQSEVHLSLEPIVCTDVRNLITSYMAEPSAVLVSTPLDSDTEGVLDNDKNRVILEDIELALESADFDPAAKRAIFTNALSHGYAAKINEVMNAIRSNGGQINLDNVDLSGLNLSDFDLEGISAVNANLSDSTVTKLNGAILVNTKIVRTCLAGANLNGATVSNICVSSSNLNNASMLGTIFNDFNIYKSHVVGIKTDDAELQALLACMDFKLTDTSYSTLQK